MKLLKDLQYQNKSVNQEEIREQRHKTHNTT